LSGIWIKAVPQLDHRLNALFGQHSDVFAGVGFVGGLSAVENLDKFLHSFNSSCSKRTSNRIFRCSSEYANAKIAK
jgi:hypothetical protein